MGRQQVPIDCEQVSLGTATVELTIITVGGKQMTKAVFMQIEERDIDLTSFDEVKSIWGWVNVPYKYEDEELDENVWIVYSKEAKLYKCRLGGRAAYVWSYCPRHIEDKVSTLPDEERKKLIDCLKKVADFAQEKISRQLFIAV